MEEDKKKQEFDLDFSPQAIVNKEAAKDQCDPEQTGAARRRPAEPEKTE